MARLSPSHFASLLPSHSASLSRWPAPGTARQALRRALTPGTRPLCAQPSSLGLSAARPRSSCSVLLSVRVLGPGAVCTLGLQPRSTGAVYSGGLRTRSGPLRLRSEVPNRAVEARKGAWEGGSTDPASPGRCAAHQREGSARAGRALLLRERISLARLARARRPASWPPRRAEPRLLQVCPAEHWRPTRPGPASSAAPSRQRSPS